MITFTFLAFFFWEGIEVFSTWNRNIINETVIDFFELVCHYKTMNVFVLLRITLFMEKKLEQQFVEIKSKIKKLKARNQRLETENEELRKSVFEYLQQLERQKKEVEKLNESSRHGLLTQAIKMDKKNLQKEIDKYILLMDKCIASVNAKF